MPKSIPLYKQYQDKKPIGVMSLCSTFGCMIYAIEHGPDDIAITAWTNPENAEKWEFHRNRIHYTQSGKAFIRKCQLRLYMTDFART